MSIDRIGKGGGVTPPGVGPTDRASGKGSFEVGSTEATSGATGVSPAERVQRGELSMSDYVDLRVNEATKHLEGKLGPGDLARVKDALREQLAHDPAVREMVRAATGALPPDGE